MAGKTENKSRRPSGRPTGRPKGKPRTAAEIAADAKRTGRPGLTPEANATKTVAMRLTPPEFEQFKREGEKRGMGLAAVSRHCWKLAEQTCYGKHCSGRKNEKD